LDESLCSTDNSGLKIPLKESEPFIFMTVSVLQNTRLNQIIYQTKKNTLKKKAPLSVVKSITNTLSSTYKQIKELTIRNTSSN